MNVHRVKKQMLDNVVGTEIHIDLDELSFDVNQLNADEMNSIQRLNAEYI